MRKVWKDHANSERKWHGAGAIQTTGANILPQEPEVVPTSWLSVLGCTGPPVATGSPSGTTTGSHVYPQSTGASEIAEMFHCQSSQPWK